MRGVIRVVEGDGPGGFARAHIGHAGIKVERGKVGTAHRLVLIEQQARAIDLAVVIQRLRTFEVADGFVDAVLLLLEQGGVKPRGRVMRIELLREAQFTIR